MNSMISLCGKWKVTFPDGKQKLVDVPGCFDLVSDNWDIAQTVVYTRDFECSNKGKMARLTFDGVSYACKVWLNGIFLGTHE